MNTVLEEVKAAEGEADKIVEQARQQSQGIISEARSNSARLLKEKEDELSIRKAHSLEKQKERVLAARQKLLAEGSEKLESLEKSAGRNAADAVALVMEAFEREIGV
ncbi:hypothetical protein HYU17_00495 [Candidatus Woesearchaeota archaeon]|nr:hypothetical protein [Candidatus Woesearchaeota archaeon]